MSSGPVTLADGELGGTWAAQLLHDLLEAVPDAMVPANASGRTRTLRSMASARAARLA